jgi:Alcohol dehydrogenase, class IV
MVSIKYAAYRVFQFFFYKAARLLYWPAPVMLQGPGSVLQLPQEVKRQGAFRVLFVTDRGIMALHLADALLQALRDANISCTVFDSVMPNPTIEMIETARSAYAEQGCQGFVAFGGGSVIDTAKAAAARIAKPRRTIAQMGGFLKVGAKLPPIFAVPTTAGTGSEVTIAAVVTDETTHHKYAVNDPRLIPSCAVLDPCLTEKLPPAITADTGMDALTHAVEAYITWGVSKKCRRLSEEAVRLIFENLPRAYQSGTDLEARMNMLLASFKAGDSFTRAGLTYVHTIAHTLGGLYGTPHGRANAVLLPIVLKAYGGCADRQLARLAGAAELDVKGRSEAEAAAAFIEAVRQMNRSMEIPETFDYIKKDDIPQMVKWALAEANPWYPVPKFFSAAELTGVINQIVPKEAGHEDQ